MGKANGSRERAPDDRLRVPTNIANGGHGARAPPAHPTITYAIARLDIRSGQITARGMTVLPGA